MADVTITMTRANALALNLIACGCGHPPNNHFDHGDRPCARCQCRRYEECARRGTLIATDPLQGASMNDLIAEIRRRGWTLVTMDDGITRVVDLDHAGSDGQICSIVLERAHDDAPAHFLFRLGALP